MPYIDDQPLPIEHRIKLLYKIIHVLRAHRPQMQITDIVMTHTISLLAAGELPFPITQIEFVPRRMRPHYFLIRPPTPRYQTQLYGYAYFIRQQHRNIRYLVQTYIVDG